MPRLVSTCLLVASAFTALAGRAAHACSPPSCEPVVVAPADQSHVPANLPGFPVLDETSLRSDAGVTETAIELFGPDGKAIALERRPTAGGGLFVPRAPLTPGQHELRFVQTCDLTVGPRPSPNVVRKITVTPEAPLPTTAGTATASTSLVADYAVPTGSGSCYDLRTVALATVKLTPSPELAPYLSLARFSVKFDGRTWGTSVWGGGERVPPNPYVTPKNRALEIYTVCENGKRVAGQEEGEYKGELTVELPGVPALPPVPFSFRLDCNATAKTPANGDGGAPDTALQPDGGAVDAPMGGSSEAGSARPSLGNDDGGDEGSGCSMGQARPGRTGAGALACAAAFLLFGVRHTRRRRRHEA
jgi:hypothetical protein